jgi:hypothetical protein
MSEYTSTSVTVQVTPTNAELITEALSATLGAPSTWIPSADLQLLRTQLATTTDPSSLSSLLGSPALRRTSGTSSALTEAKHALASGETLPMSTRRQLDTALHDLELATLQAERTAITTLTERAMGRLGFAVRTGAGNGLDAIEARRNHEVLLVAVHAGDQMEVDTIGHGGDTCEATMAELTSAMAEDGLDVRVRRRVRHGNPQGGSLIDRAAQAGDGDLVTGLIASYAHQSGEVPTVRTPSRLREGS